MTNLIERVSVSAAEKQTAVRTNTDTMIHDLQRDSGSDIGIPYFIYRLEQALSGKL